MSQGLELLVGMLDLFGHDLGVLLVLTRNLHLLLGLMPGSRTADGFHPVNFSRSIYLPANIVGEGGGLVVGSHASVDVVRRLEHGGSLLASLHVEI